MHIRHSKLLSLVNQHNRIAVADLAKALDVSEVTIRKDLNILAKKGLLRREHGFARLTTSDDVGNHLSFNYEAKLRIARRAAESVHNGETVMIESGSCCTLLAEELAMNRRDVTIITNSAFIASFVRKSPSAHIILLGGEYQNESQVMIGPMIRKCVSDFYVDKFFIASISQIQQALDILFKCLKLNLYPFIRFDITIQYFLLIAGALSEDEMLREYIEYAVVCYLFTKYVITDNIEAIDFLEYYQRCKSANISELFRNAVFSGETSCLSINIKDAISSMTEIFRDIFQNAYEE